MCSIVVVAWIWCYGWNIIGVKVGMAEGGPDGAKLIVWIEWIGKRMSVMCVDQD